MNKTQLLQELVASRIDILKAIENLPDNLLDLPGVAGNWSIKDIMAHLLMWEAETIRLLYQTRNNIRPVTAHFSPKSEDELNATWVSASKERTLDQVLEDFFAIREQTLQQVDSFSDKELNNPDKFSWLKGKSLVGLLEDYLVKHDREHAAQIQAWRKAQPSQ